MKKGVFALLVVLLIATLVLSACAATSTSSSSGSSATGGKQPLTGAPQMAVGILKLEGGANAVTAQQAKDLVPLWQAYSQLAGSDSAAQAELDGVVAQIKSTLTANQLKAIDGMNLTRQDMLTEISLLGLVPGASTTGTPQAFTFNPNSGGNNGGGAPGGSAAGGPPSGGAAPSGGGAPSGGFVAGGGSDLGGLTGGQGQTGASGTQVAPAQTQLNRIPNMLLNALIELLQKRSAS